MFPRVASCTAMRRLVRWRSVAVGISGGVDSSVTALLLKDAGWNVQGVFIKSWDRSEEEAKAFCTETDDERAAQAVCRELGIPFRVVDLSREYWARVFEPFLAVYAAGSTPNPDTDCNRFIKFGAFRDYALRELRVDCVATGHYARLSPPISVEKPDCPLPPEHSVEGAPPPRLLSAADPAKDQSDFLSLVSGEALRRVLFPVGGMAKREVRAIAAARGLSSAARRDSYGICLVGKRGLPGFLNQFLRLTPGTLRDVTAGGAVVGEHDSVEAFTVGQRARVGGLQTALYFAGKGCGPCKQPCDRSAEACDAAALWVVPGLQHPALYARASVLRLADVAWSAGAPPPGIAAAEAAARRRCGSEPTPALPAPSPDVAAVLDQTRLGRAAIRWPHVLLRYRLRHSQLDLRTAVFTVAWRSEVERLCQLDVIAGWHEAQGAILPAPVSPVAAQRSAHVATRESASATPVAAQGSTSKTPLRYLTQPLSSPASTLPFVWRVRSPPRMSLPRVRPGPAPSIRRACAVNVGASEPPTLGGSPSTSVDSFSGVAEAARPSSPAVPSDELLLIALFAKPQRAVAPGQVMVVYAPEGEEAGRSDAAVGVSGPPLAVGSLASVVERPSPECAVSSGQEESLSNGAHAAHPSNAATQDAGSRLQSPVVCLGGAPILSPGPSLWDCYSAIPRQAAMRYD